ncbi:MAG: YraN family protein, partial [Bdellovibrio sp.]
MLAHQRGRECEALVRKHYERRGYCHLRSNYRHPCAEIDLLFEDSRHRWIVVEVKSDSHPEFRSHRVSFPQKLRLQRAALSLAQTSGREIQIHLAFVDKCNQVEIL